MKWFTRLFGKRKSSAVPDTSTTAAKPAETTTPEPDASAETTATESATAAATAAEPANEEPAKAEEPVDSAPADEPEESPADPAINTLDSEREVAQLPESPAAEETPAAEDTPAAEEAAAGKKSAEPPAFSAGVPVATEPAVAPEETPAAEDTPAAEEAAAGKKVAPEPVAETPAAGSTVAEVVDAPAAGEDGPFGPGSAKPLPDGSAPGEEFTVKGKRSSKLFHTTASPYFGRTKADVWFKTPADAESAGFSAWNHKKKAAAK